MTFLSPWRLVALLVVVALVIAYFLVQRSRKKYALRFSSTELMASVIPKRASYKRHIPPALFLLAMTTTAFAVAEPAALVSVPTEKATLVLAIDVSLSMQSEDVDPTRFDAAKLAATDFIDTLPETIELGLVSFSGTAAVEVSPTSEHTEVTNALDRLDLAEATAVGDAILLSLRAAEAVGLDENDEPIPATIVVLSDGETTVGTPEEEAIEAAIEAGIPISTISFGTRQGTIRMVDPNFPELGELVTPVPVADENLQEIAEQTGGSYFSADSISELDDIYTDIGLAVSFDEEEQEITDWFAAAALLLFTLAGGFSLLWSQRLP